MAYKQKKQAIAAMHFEKAMKLTISQNGEDCTDLINIYQSLGKVQLVDIYSLIYLIIISLHSVTA